MTIRVGKLIFMFIAGSRLCEREGFELVIARSSGRKPAFVQKEFACGHCTEVGRRTRCHNCGKLCECSRRGLAAHSAWPSRAVARQGEVGMIVALGRKAEPVERVTYGASERRKFGCVRRKSIDPSPEDSRRARIGEESDASDVNLEARCVDLAQACAHGVGVGHFTEELEGCVIGVAADEAHSGQAELQGAYVVVQALPDGFVDVECNK